MPGLIRAFHRHVLSRTWLCFAVMCTCFGLFGAGTLNLFNMFSANWDLITHNGAMALADGAARQLLELVLTLAISMLNYTVFKACEVSLVKRIVEPFNTTTPHPDHEDRHPAR